MHALPTYAELVAALEAGEQVHAVVRYGQCLLDHQAGPDVVAGFDFDGFEEYPKASVGNPVGFVVTTRTRWAQDSEVGHVRSFVRLKVYEDERVELVLEEFGKKDKLLTMRELGCGLGESSGLTLYSAG
jgi:hypothetical protein